MTRRVDLGIDWVGYAENQINDRSIDSLNYGSVWVNDELENSPYYPSSYKCPYCDDDRAALYKLKLEEGVRTTAPKVFNGEIGLWNLFTCPKCGAWFASLNYIEGAYDLTSTPGYQVMATDFTLGKRCLFSRPSSSYDDWARCLRKTLSIAKD